VKWLIGLLLAAAVAVAVFFITLNRDPSIYLGALQSAVEDATGRKLTVNGEIKLSLFPHPTLELNDVALSNAAWGSRPDMIRAKKMAAQLDRKQLLVGGIRFRYIRLHGVDLLLEQNAKGTGNWVMGDASAGSDNGGGGFLSLLQNGRVDLSRSRVVYRKPGIEPVAIGIPKLTVKPTRKGALAINGDMSWKKRLFRLDGKVMANKQSYEARLVSDGLQATAHGGWAKSAPPVVFTAKLDTPALLNPLLDLSLPDIGAVAASGKYDPAGPHYDAQLTHDSFTAQASGKPDSPVTVSVKITQPAQLASRLNIWLPASAPITISGVVTPARKQVPLKISKLQAKAGETDLAGELSIRQQPLALDMRLQSKRLRVQDLIQKTEQGDKDKAADAPAAGKKRVFSDQPMAMDWLKNLQLTLDAGIGELQLDAKRQIMDVNLKAVINNRRLDLKLNSMRWADGDWQGRVVVDGGQQVPAVSASLSTRKAALARLIPDAEKWLQGGELALKGELRGRGRSAHEIAASLNGTLDLRLGQMGVAASGLKFVAGGLLAQTLGALTPKSRNSHAGGEGFTRFDCTVAWFDIRKGVASAPKTIGMESKYFNVGGEGSIDLGKEKLDLHFIPKPRKGLGVSLSTVSNIVMLGGTLSQPKIQVGGKELLKSGASISAALATGGTSLLVQSLFNRVTSEQFSCENTLKRIAAVAGSGQAGVTAPEPNPELKQEPETEPGPQPASAPPAAPHKGATQGRKPRKTGAEVFSGS